MAEFQPQRAASAAVGTPGLSRTAGTAAQSLSEATAQINQGEQAVADAQRNALIGGAAAIGGAIAIGLREKRQAAAAQKAMNNQMQVTRDVHKFERFVDDTREDIKMNMRDDPEKAELEFDRRIQKYLVDSGGEKQYDSDLKAKAKYVEGVEGATTRETDKMRSWSSTRRTAISQSQSATAIDEEALNLANRNGSAAELFVAFGESQDRVNRMLTSAANPIGFEKAQELGLKARTKLSEAFFENLAGSRPDDLQKRLTHVQVARVYLDKAEKQGFSLDPGTKKRFQNTFDSLENQYTKDLQDHLVVEDYKRDFEVSVQKQYVDQHWNNAGIQQAALNLAETRSQELAKQAELVAADRTLPDTIKNQYIKLYKTEIGHLDSLTMRANANLKALASEAKADARHSESMRRQAAADARREQAEAKREKKEDQAMVRDSVSREAYALREEIYALSLNPEKNYDALKAKSAELYKFASKHGEGPNAPLSPSFAAGSRQQALTTLEKANEYGREVNPVAAFFGNKGALKKLDEEKARQKQSEAVQGIVQAAKSMKDVNTQIDTNRSIPAWTSKQEDMFQEKYQIIKENASKNGWGAAEVAARANRLRNFLLTQGGK
jgi:hypothetical protein